MNVNVPTTPRVASRSSLALLVLVVGGAFGASLEACGGTDPGTSVAPGAVGDDAGTGAGPSNDAKADVPSEEQVSSDAGIVEDDATVVSDAHQATGWCDEVAASSVADTPTAIAVDSSGGVHVLFGASPGKQVTYARRESTGVWTIEPVDTISDASWRAGLVTRDGAVHVSYYDVANVDMKYAYRSAAGVWSRQIIDTMGGEDSAIAVDDAGGVHIAYRKLFGSYNQAYAYRPPGGTFSVETADDLLVESLGKASSIAVDGAGGVHISHQDETHQDLRVSHRAPAGGWTTDTVDSEGNAGLGTSLSAGGTGELHVSYLQNTEDALRYAHRPVGGAWAVESNVAALSGGTGPTSIAVDSAGVVHVVYTTGPTNGALHHTFRSTSGTWTTEAIVLQHARFAAMTIDGSDRLHVVYRNATGGLVYTRPCP